MVIPASKFTVQAGEDYLDQIYGDNSGDIAGHDQLASGEMVVAYRIKKAVSDWVKQEFASHQVSHLYTAILNDVLNRSLPSVNFVAIRFYTKHMVIAVLKNKELQLIQSFNYEVEEDILYYLLSVIQQFDLDPALTHAEITGSWINARPLPFSYPACSIISNGWRVAIRYLFKSARRSSCTLFYCLL